MREIRTSGSMSGDGKRSVAAWPKLPRPSSTLPRSALAQFIKRSAAKLANEELSPEAVKAVRAIDQRVCPLVCQSGERAEGERCVRLICPAGQVLKDGNCLPERTATDAGTRTPPAPKPSSSGKCFSFQGRQFCE
jgi:hypothetical protein